MLDLEKSEKLSKHLFSVLKAVRNINRLIIREKNINVILPEACDILIEARGYNSAWLGLLKDEKNFSMVVGSPPKEAVSRFCEQVLQGEIPPCIKKVIIQKIPFLVVDQSRECRDCYLKDELRCKQSVIICIKRNHKCFGLLGIMLAPDVCINEEEKGLLEESTDDLAFCLQNIETEKKQKQAEEKYRKLIKATSEGFWLLNSKKLTIEVNQSLCDMLGYTLSLIHI